ncbi:MAG TPA: 2-oxoacid:acceptor oxidoreductase family protein, partial [Kiritimatiellia bacterium]|nr:2-oxoacid:acceptor oxidoreductase family protein [Kiritimatiellia bacterium]
VVTMPAIDLAIKMGVPKAANTMMLAALARTGVTRLQDAHLLAALDASFKNKPALVEKNRLLMREAEAWLDKNAAL